MNNIKLFQEKKIRSVWNEEEQQWYFSVVDVVCVLTDSVNPTDYLKKMRKRDEELATYLGTNCPQIEMVTDTGKKRKTLAANVQALFRIIQSIPSPKAEPFKLWLAQVGYERVQEIPSDYKMYKGLTKKSQNLRDHMSDLELIFTMLGERVTTEISQKEKPDTFTKNKQVAQRGGNVAGVAREQAEKELGGSVVSPENFLSDSDKQDDTLELPFFENDE